MMVTQVVSTGYEKRREIRKSNWSFVRENNEGRRVPIYTKFD